MSAPSTLRDAGEELIDAMRSGTIKTRAGERYDPRTIDACEAALRDRIVPILGDKQLGDVQPRDIQRLARDLSAEGANAPTIRTTLMPLRVIFQRAVEDGDLVASPLAGLRLGQGSGRRRPIALAGNARNAPQIIAPHVPRTGGTSFRSVLEAVYGSDNVEGDYERHVTSSLSLFNLDFEAWSRKTRAALERRTSWPKAVTGHFWLGKYETFRRSAFTVVWLREPAARLISLYFFLRDHRFRTLGGERPRSSFFEQAVSLEDFIEGYCASRRTNPVTRTILDGYSLKDLDFVGIQEHFEEDVTELAQTLGWPSVDVPHDNRTTSSDYRALRPDAVLLRKIRESDEADVALYQHALELRRRRLAART